jgi:lactate dehydrogenase-like 2-hydroxyacid dehydrogenase
MPDTKPLVLVTGPEYLKCATSFERAATFDCVRAPDAEEELASAIRESGARYVIVGNRKYSGPLYDAMPAGGVIARLGVGHDGIDKKLATAAGVLCTNTPGVLDQSVAEHAMLLIAAAARQLIPALAAMNTEAWTSPAGRDLYGKRLAIVGCGGIGRALARIATVGYGMRAIGCTRPGAPPPASLEHFASVTNEFADAVRDADFVSLHMPARPENAGFIDRARLEQMRGSSWLVNTARGAVVDEAALFDALASKRIAGAALDVFAREPYIPAAGGGDLRSLPNVILTPHVGSNTVESNTRMAERALMNINFARNGEVGRMDVVNRDVLTIER